MLGFIKMVSSLARENNNAMYFTTAVKMYRGSGKKLENQSSAAMDLFKQTHEHNSTTPSKNNHSPAGYSWIPSLIYKNAVDHVLLLLCA